MKSKFIDNNDGTVTDEATGLTWQQVGTSNSMTWKKALVYCEGLNLGDYTDWRLPTIQELLSLVDYRRYNSAITVAYFPNTASSFYWSSTTHAYGTYSVWGVDFSYGFNILNYKYDSYYVRAVRGGQPGGSTLDASVI